MKKIMAVLGLVGFLLVSACSEEVKTPEWYVDHPKELAPVYKECKASGNDTPNCRNAIAAQFLIQQKNAKVPTFDFNLQDEMKKDSAK
ncbi:hypothetical protein ALP90_200136 [Pseudomonas amygdali pv. ulmi]|uniref:EexN family lipoprotein n=1 Tax=Pseudomonas amygdali pv. ulmi TaxID=251720 RepID=A0A3M4S9J7_PSEA0|nr:EexN family lipoprotein [Pseudomonas amygdali]RMR11246.1 hypothetical protein ALP90_200136 [Pseudomonas amygdali pv. ulmi]